jgi:hypothetical protein
MTLSGHAKTGVRGVSKLWTRGLFSSVECVGRDKVLLASLIHATGYSRWPFRRLLATSGYVGTGQPAETIYSSHARMIVKHNF